MKMSRLTAFFVFRNSALPKKCFAFNEVKLFKNQKDNLSKINVCVLNLAMKSNAG